MPATANIKEPLKAFIYGFLSVLTFGLIPSYMERTECPQIVTQPSTNAPFGGLGILHDMQSVVRDVARGGAKVTSNKA